MRGFILDIRGCRPLAQVDTTYNFLVTFNMPVTTQIGYDVEEMVLQLWLKKHFGPQFNSRGAMVWTYSVSPPHWESAS